MRTSLRIPGPRGPERWWSLVPPGYDRVVRTRLAWVRQLTEIARMTKGDVRLLEPILRSEHHVPRWRWRVMAVVRDRPLELAELPEVGLVPAVVGGARFGGTYSFVQATRWTPLPAET